MELSPVLHCSIDSACRTPSLVPFSILREAHMLLSGVDAGYVHIGLWQATTLQEYRVHATVHCAAQV